MYVFVKTNWVNIFTKNVDFMKNALNNMQFSTALISECQICSLNLLQRDDVACKTKLYVLHTKSTVPFVLACVYVRY